ncbi:amino acid adenylation domain-containing protein [Dokdonia ponticola]|uniref:Amino acid adenylation domain-containing protein n=1 Tax=Dokdonia ponticola TaxID=2041041 RepID=A0ABV9HXS5_9FLAO
MIAHLIHTLQSLKIGLKVVDGNLKINAPKGTLTPEIIDQIKMHKSELVALLSSSESIPKAAKKDYYALTSSQQRLWTLSQFEAGNTAYNIFNAFEFKGEIDIDVLSLAYIKLIERHESLRTIFKEDEQGQLSQYIIPMETYTGALQFVDLSDATTHDIRAYSEAMQMQAFNLAQGPLFIGSIVKVADHKHILMFTMHHIIGDGWSMELLNKEFIVLYNGLSLGQEVILPELPIQYKDYSEWQNTDTRKALLEKSKTFWLDTFSGALPVLELPSYKIRPKHKTYNGSSIYHKFSETFTSQLNTYAQQNEATLFMVLMTGINGLLSRYANTRDIILGTPVAGREHSDLENQVGLYLNTLAIRTRFEQTTSFEELLAIQKNTLLNAYTHQEYPFDRLVEELEIKRDISRSVLFDTLVVFQNQQELLFSEEVSLQGIEISSYDHIQKSFSKFDLSFSFAEVGGRIHLNLGYNTDIYLSDFIEKIIYNLECFLEIGISNSKEKIDVIDFLSQEEKQQVLVDFNNTQVTYSKEKTVIDLFLNQAKETPDATAIQCDNKNISYQELDVLSNQLAYYIVNTHKVSKEEIISIKLEKSEWFVISVLAVLKAGCTYLPIDINYPEERITYITSNSDCKLTIDEALLTNFRMSDTTYPREFATEISELAYVIYTSGSTGKPKGVMVGHDSLVNYMLHQSEYYALDKTENILYFSNIAFDASIEQLFLALLNGASLVIVSKDDIMDVTNFSKVLKKHKITHFHATPSYIGQIQDIESCKGLRRIICAGEACPKELAERLGSNVDFYNKYGPTETTISSTIYKYDAQKFIGQSVPIGKPISNTEIYILSEDELLQPMGVVGEICISGDGLSRGYLNQPALTKEKFVFNRFRESGTLYKTGDLGRWLPDGNIEFVGRKDDQVKIRGYRIELGEIENTLVATDSINQAVVTVSEFQGEDVLVAYYTSDEVVDKQVLRTSLRSELPDYMVPSYFVALDMIPLTANGKVDKKALPVIASEDLIKNEYVAPVTEVEQQLVAIWEEVLGMHPIGITDNFFELGGHSLKVTLIVNKIKKELGLELSVKDVFLHPTISEITGLLTESTQISIPKSEDKPSYALTSSQRRLWVLSQFEQGSIAYNIPAVFQLKGSLDITLIEEVFSILIARHESLRTRFMRDDQEEVRQYILSSSDVNFLIEQQDLSDVKDQEAAIADVLEANNSHCFDLSNAPLVKAGLVKLATDDYLLVLNMHHIISDGWSMEVLSKEFMMVYASLVKGEAITLPTLSIQYKDYAEWLATEAGQSKLVASETYWLGQFDGELPILELPTFTARPKIKTYNGNAINHHFSKELSIALRTFSEQRGVSLFMTLMAGLNALLSRYANTTDIVLGTPVAGRDEVALENQIGLYLNTLAIRTQFDNTFSFEELLELQKNTLLDAYAYQEYPFDSLVDTLDVQQDTSRSALFDVIVVLQNQQNLFGGKEVAIKGLEIAPFTKQHRQVSQFDLSFIFSETTDQLSLHLDYNTDIYEKNFIENLVSHLENLFKACLENSNQSITKINFLTEEDTHQLVTSFNDTKVPYNIEKTIVEVFAAQVEKTPDAIALTYNKKQLTYKEIDALSNQMAHYLLSNFELSNEDIVGVILGRSEWLVISLLSVLKTGCAYVPIDPSYPKQRIEYIQEDSNCVITINEAVIDSFLHTENLPTSLPKVHIAPSNLAYVIYTSGSTGRPKGVMIEHRSVLNLCFWHIDVYGVTPSSRGSLYAGIGFDASVWEMYPYLVSGASLFPISDSEVRYDATLLAGFLKEHAITHAYLPTKICEALIAQDITLENTKILTGGEALKFPEGKQGLHIYNNYGPSENTVVTTSFDLKNRVGESIPIGTPVSNTQIYILSEDELLQPLGVVGEICISGDGLSRGYLNQPALTKEKFVFNRFRESGTLYKTGDLGRWLPDGNIEFVGRKDDQVKIRGYRIELGEIENTLVATDNINQAVVTVSEFQGEDVLVAYYTSDELVDKQVLRTSLRSELPDYMVPSYFVALDMIPLTANGKVDKKALPVIASEDLIKNEYVAPVTEVEQQLVAIWEEVLGMHPIGITDNFFELGGHSLKVTLIVNKIKKELGLELSVKDVFLHPTISEITGLLTESTQISIPKSEDKPSYALTSSQRRLWVLSQFEQGSIAYNIPAVFQLKGSLDITLIEEVFSILIARHESLRTRFMRDDQEEVRQYILSSSDVDFLIEQQDLSDVKDQEAAIADVLEANNNHCFDLSNAPLVKAGLVKLATDDYLLVLNMHHIISDGWSMEVLSKEFMMVYASLVKGEAITLPTLSIQYKDYAEWLATEAGQSKLVASEAYWLGQFEEEVPVLELPTFKARPKIKTYNGDYLTHTFSEEVRNQVHTFSENNGVSVFMTLMAGLNALLSRYTNTTDIVLGTPVAGRDQEALENQIGLYLNTLAIRTQFDDKASFDTLLTLQKETLLDAYAHQVYPLDDLINTLDIPRDTSRSALFDIMVVFQNQQNLFGEHKDASIDLEISPYIKQHRQVSQFDISFVFSDQHEELTLQLEYNTDIYDIVFVEKIATHFEELIKECIAKPTRRITEISYTTKSERQQLLYDFNKTDVVYPKDKTIVELFVDQVKETPESIAIIFKNKEYTYRELDEVSNRLANYLLKHYDFAIEDLVGVKLDNNVWQIISIIAILKAGCAYVPIDTNYPVQRIAYMERDSACKVTIDKDVLEAFNSSEEISNVLPAIKYSSNNLAYVMYTSGSTGNPKGVMVEHKNIIRLVKSANFYQLSTTDVLLSTGAFSFDATTFEYWGTLLNGGCLVLCSKDTLLDNELLSSEIKERNVNVMWFTAGWLQMLVDTSIGLFAPLSTVLAGGDKLSPKHIAILKSTYPELEIINGYGPTENTTFSLTYTIPEVGEDIPIGYPISNSTAYILSDNLDVQPIGVVGEICLGGDGLSRGYLNRPDLTAEKFVFNRFCEPSSQAGRSGILYKTGDLGRWLPDGRIAFMGRKDTQVKIRGYRVELSEIEYALLYHNEITQAVVIIKDVEGAKEIVSYIVSKTFVDKQQLRASLRMMLPDYMLPSYYVVLDTIPLTSNGKVDRKSLPEVTLADTIQQEYIAPRTDTEVKIASLWCNILQKHTIGATDNFFELGGHSLKATQLIHEYHQIFQIKLSLKEVFSNQTLESHAVLLEKAKVTTHYKIPNIPKSESYVVSAGQQRLWTLCQLDGGSEVYNMPFHTVLEGDYDIDCFCKAVLAVIDRHEILRTVFKLNDEGELRQYITSSEVLDFKIGYTDFREASDSLGDAMRYINEDAYSSFDLEVGPLFRVSLLRTADDSYIFYYNMHHIISDGWSMAVISKDVLAFYESFKTETPLAIHSLNIQYKDYAAWQLSKLDQDESGIDKAYWTSLLSGELPLLNLPSSLLRPSIKTHHGNGFRTYISKEDTSALKDFSQQYNGSLFISLLSIWNVLFYKYTSAKDIVIGSPVAGRDHADLGDQIGFYVNMLALRNKIHPSESFVSLFNRVKNTTLASYEHQMYPFDHLVEAIDVKRDISRSAIFDVMLVLQNTTDLSSDMIISEEDVTTITDSHKKVSKYDIEIGFQEIGDYLSFDMTYNTDVYEADMIKNLMSHFKQLLHNILKTPLMSLDTIPYLKESEKHYLLHELNNTSITYPKNNTIVDLFVKQAKKTPHSTALICDDKEFTYQELDEKSNELSNYLLSYYELNSEDLIGVKIARDEWMLIAILAILKSGCAYVPIDPNYPQQRIAYIEEDSQCKVTIDKDLLDAFTNENDIPNKPPKVTVTADALAYVIYTSGSTGKPKGVMITHNNAVAMLHWAIREFKYTDFDILYAVTSHCFDLSVYEFFYPLSIGKKIRLLSNGLVIGDYLHTERNVLLNTVPSVIQTLLDKKVIFKNAVAINLAGEAFPLTIADRFAHSGIEMRNLYGPSEDTTYSSYLKLEGSYKRSVPIGKPLDNTQFYILSENLELQPLGVVGEICISGEGLARGYLNQPELTKEKFIDHPYVPGERLYKTGDLGRWLFNGTIEYMGRKDSQVKVRGYRIELGEIEHVLMSCNDIDKAVVMVNKVDNDPVIVTYLVSNSPIDKQKLRVSLGSQLPDYMIPSYYVILDAIPLTPNGKVDKNALPTIEEKDIIKQEYVAPETDIEKRLVEMWGEVLGIKKVGVTDNFFELGGNSLKAMNLIFKIKNEFNTQVNIQQVFVNPTIAFLAVSIENSVWNTQHTKDLKKIII